MAGDNFSDLSRMIEAVSKEKSIEKQVVIDAVIQGMLVAARKKYGTYREIEAQYNEDSGEVELYEFKEVVMPEDFIDEEIEIKLDEARELNPEIQVNDSIGIKLDATELGRIAAQTAKQIITQKVRDAEREIIYNEFEQRRGEVASGIARRVERGMIVVDLGKTEAFIPLREQIPGEVYKPGDRVQGYLLDVRQTTRGPQIIMSRACEQYLIKLFEQEVPEIYDGIVQIIAAAREPGARAKIAVVSKDPAVDPVGACVGMKGSRVQQVVQELRGEKIDIINWDEDITRFACNALAPAEISRVFVDEANKEMEIVVPDTQLSLAIGRKGQNVRLASKISGWKLDILSESAASQKTADAIFNLLLIPGMSETMAQNVFQSGFGSFQSLAEAKVGDVMAIPGYNTPELADKLIADAKALIEKYKSEGIPVPAAPVKAPAAAPVGSAKSQADERLRAELAALNKQETAPSGAASESAE
jgi:N utilization substance protein A